MKTFNDKIFKFLQKRQKNCNKADLHSFTINTTAPCGKAFVECRGYEIYIELHASENVDRWVGTTVAAANRLEKFGADYLSIEL